MSSKFNCVTKLISSIFLCLILCSLDSLNANNLHKEKKNISKKSHIHKMKHQHKSQISLQSKQKDKKQNIPKSPADDKTKSVIVSDQNKIIKEITSKKNKNQDTSMTNIQRKDIYSYANLIEKCNVSICPPPNSCTTDHICKCSEERANYDEEAFGDFDKKATPTYCNYMRKEQLIAFVLEFMFISAGHFYIRSYLLGSLKLFLIFGALILVFRYDEKWSKILSTVVFSLLSI